MKDGKNKQLSLWKRRKSQRDFGAPNRLSIWTSKKGFNDMSILFVIFALFVVMGTIIPFVNSAFGTSGSTNDIDGLVDNVGQDPTITSINGIMIIGSIFKMFFWTFGSLPFWLDMIFIPIRLIFAVTLARNIWVGGGA